MEERRKEEEERASSSIKVDEKKEVGGGWVLRVICPSPSGLHFTCFDERKNREGSVASFGRT